MILMSSRPIHTPTEWPAPYGRCFAPRSAPRPTGALLTLRALRASPSTTAPRSAPYGRPPRDSSRRPICALRARGALPSPRAPPTRSRSRCSRGRAISAISSTTPRGGGRHGCGSGCGPCCGRGRLWTRLPTALRRPTPPARWSTGRKLAPMKLPSFNFK